ncbi:hypothetical protein OC844_007824, partial [Tilletia horrida]
MSSDFTLLHAAAGRPLKWPTFLAISTDCVVTRSTTGNIDAELTLMDERDTVIKANITAVGNELNEDGAYLLRHAYFGTDPLRCYVGQEGCVRLVPDEFDGTDPTCETLPWAPTLLSGIGVLVEVGEGRNRAVIQGLSFLGKGTGWRPFKVRVRADQESEDPLQQFPRVLSLVSFHAALHRMGKDGVLEAKLHRIAYLQPAYSLLLGQLGIIPGQLGKDRAISALLRLNKDFRKVQRLVNADDDSVDSID